MFRGLNPWGTETHQTWERKGYLGFQPPGTLGDHEKSFGDWELVQLLGAEIPIPKGM